ncbi:MAG: hypothetical protein H0X44_00450 [Acidobacteria bacterium]|nr:hypothetical protein [Acidobacteriota bacterium]
MRLLLAASLLALTLPSVQAVPDSAMPERFTAFGVSLGGMVSPPATAQVELSIERWSTADELDTLLDALENGQRSLVTSLRDLSSVGMIRTAQSLGYDLRYAHQQVEADGTRRIFLATDRPVGYWEMVNQRASLGYPITVVELTVDAKGRGEGALSVAARLTASSDRTRLYVSNYDVRPVMLKEVRRRD